MVFKLFQRFKFSTCLFLLCNLLKSQILEILTKKVKIHAFLVELQTRIYLSPCFFLPQKVGHKTKFKYLLTLSLFLKVLTLILEKVEFQDLYYQMQVTRCLKVYKMGSAKYAFPAAWICGQHQLYIIRFIGKNVPN